MKFSAHCNIKNALSQNYPYVESILSFAFFCDEVIVVDGGSTDESVTYLLDEVEKAGYAGKVKVLMFDWPDEWNWNQIHESLNFGYTACTGDVVIKFDVDYVFDQKTADQFIQFCHAWMNDESHPTPPMAMTLHKINLIKWDKSFKKARMPLALNKRDYPQLCYGQPYKGDPDFSAAIVHDMDANYDKIPIGHSILEFPELIRDTPGAVWVYDFTFMTRPVIEGIIQRAARARMRANEAMPDEIRSKIVSDLAMGSMRKFMRHRAASYNFQRAPLSAHPEIMHEKLKSISSEMFGENAFGFLSEMFGENAFGFLDDIKMEVES